MTVWQPAKPMEGGKIGGVRTPKPINIRFGTGDYVGVRVSLF